MSWKGEFEVYNFEKEILQKKIREILGTEDISFGFIGDFIKDTQARKIVEVVTPDGSLIPKYLDSDEAIIEFYYTSKEQLICIKEKIAAIKNMIHDCGYAIKCIYEAPDSSNGLGTVNICFTKARSKE